MKNEKWVNDQLKRAGTDAGISRRITALLDAFEELDISPEDAPAVLTAFSSLAQNESLVPDAPEEVWVSVQRGLINVADEVRVKHNAFEGNLGIVHNGRRGKVVAIRSGDIIFRSTDNLEPFMDGTHYQPEKLEKRIR